MYTRYCKTKITEALADTPVVIVSGPRQSGKTTLAKQINPPNSIYITLDDITQKDAANHDPVGFIRNLDGSCIVIDEVQRVPDLFLSIKQDIDENRRPGKYLLTGSSNALMMPQVADSLAGRMEVINLLPLTTCEMDGVPSTFFEKILEGIPPKTKKTRVRDLIMRKILVGGFPVPVSRKEFKRQVVWHQQYINSLIQKDLADLENIEHLAVVPKLVRLLATQVGSLINYTEIANKLGISRPTVVRYVTLLEQLYLFESLSAWSKNHSKRLVKTPKVHIVDTGLLCALSRINEEKIANNPRLFGHLLESYVVNEVRRLLTWHEEPLELYHYRDKDQVEVDLVVETVSGGVIGIEVKAGATVTNSDFAGLRRLSNHVGKQFIMGIILSDVDHTTQHEDKLYSVPLGSLWE